MPEQTSTNDNAQVEQVAQRVAEVNLQPSKPSFKVHKSLFDFAIPLIQFANAGINQHHAIHVTVIIFNPAKEILLLGPRGLTPSGPVKVEVDKTLLEGINRVVKETTGMGLSTLKALLGVLGFQLPHSHSPSSNHPTSQGPMPENGGKPLTGDLAIQAPTPDDRDEESKKKGLKYAFLATIDSQSLTDAEPKGGRKWYSRAAIEAMHLDSSHRRRLLKAMSMMEDVRHEVRITPTRLIVPTFELVKALKAYLLPLEVFRALPPLKGKQLVASVAIVHPTQRKLLLVQRSATDSWPNHWEFPGGGTDPGDLTILHTAVREVNEETGLEIGRFKGSAGTFEIEKDGVVKARAYVFLAKLGPSSSSTNSSGLGEGKRGQESGDDTGKGGQEEPGADGHGEGKVGNGEVVRVVMNPEEHQAYRWVGSREEVEGLEVPPGVRAMMVDLLDALLNHTTKRSK